jgi:hypothetical protein
MGQDMQTTGVARAAKAVGKLPDDYYRFADLAGLLRQNPQVTNRLLEYPGLTSLFQRDDLQALGQDTGFTGNWQQQAPIDDLLNNGQVQGLLQNAPLVSQIATILDENYDDLIAYLKTGQSAKYDSEKILGTWDFNLGTSLVFFRQTHAKLKAADLLDIRAQWTAAYANTKLLFAGDNKIYIKQLPDFKANPVVANNLTGDWDAAGTDYKLTVTLNGESKDLMVKSTDGLRLTLKGLENPLTFDHE